VQAVVFFSINRIGRKRIEIAHDLAELARWGMAIVSVRERFLDMDQSPEMARFRDMLIQWWGWFAQSERDELIARTNMALDRVRAQLDAAGSHISKKGNVVTRLGRPEKFKDGWRERARELAETQHLTPGQIARSLAAEGFGNVHRRTVRDVIAEEAAADAS